MARRLSVSLVLAGFAATTFAAEIAYRQVDPDNYVFRLRNDAALSEAEALLVVARASSSVCGQREARPGKYRFQSVEPVGGAAAEAAPAPSPAPATATFEFLQEVACVAPAPSAAEGGAPRVYSEQEKDQAATDALDGTERYFRLLGEGNVDEAWKDLNRASGTWNESSWKQGKRDFQAMAGALHRIEITKVTVYENPQGAPEPGLYAAADYRNIWLNVPLQCGYLMWHRNAGGELLIMREESGHVTAAQLQAMPAQQQQQVPQALRCR
jgi:hypothetical protein